MKKENIIKIKEKEHGQNKIMLQNHGGTHLQNEAGAFHAPSVQPDPDPLHMSHLIQTRQIRTFVDLSKCCVPP